ncbi:MAG: hypothetical protein ACTHKB_13770 [Burkholderiaceae bacterium]
MTTFQRLIFLSLGAALTMALAGCGGGSDSGSAAASSPPPGATASTSDAFVTRVLAIIGMTSDTAAPVPVDDIAVSTPETTSPVPVN